MSAGTIVITGGILAAVILLCIVAVLCYCRLQYYCCKKNESSEEEDEEEEHVGSNAGADPLSHFPCNTCNALAMDGTDITPISLDQLDLGPAHPPCPTCSPHPLRCRPRADMHNGGGRLGFHTYYEALPASLPAPVDPRGPSPVSSCSLTDMFPPPPPRAYSTDV